MKNIWKIISVIEGIIIVFLAISVIKATGLPQNCIAIGLDGRYLCWQSPDQPTERIDLTHWKLQIPGPKEIKPIGTYTSKYFYYGANNEIIFWLDSSERGTTPNSSYVRSELREVIDPTNDNINWGLAGTHTLTAKLELTRAGAIKTTVLQIHGITKDGNNAPPLLKVVIENGDLYALIKQTNDGSKEEKVLLQKAIGRFSAEIIVENYQLKIKVNGVAKLTRNISFWKHNNYFKAGLYPQATNGISEAKFYKLEINH